MVDFLVNVVYGTLLSSSVALDRDSIMEKRSVSSAIVIIQIQSWPTLCIRPVEWACFPC